MGQQRIVQQEQQDELLQQQHQIFQQLQQEKLRKQLLRQDDPSELVLVIAYDRFITRFDLDEIISGIDTIIEKNFNIPHNPEWRISYVGITGVSQGSIEIMITLGTPVALYTVHQFVKGINKGQIPKEIQRLGKLTSDAVGSLISRVNDWAEKYVKKIRGNGSHVKSVKIRKKIRPIDDNPKALKF